jgi:lysozyme
MRVSKKGIDLIKEFEGLKLKPYKCSAGVPTIGYGSTYYENGIRVTMSDASITESKANELLQYHVFRFASKVASLVKQPLTENQFSALVSFAYNVGSGALASSTLLKLVNNNPNDANIAKEFLKWNKVNKVPVQGLTNRRIKESALYFTK